MASLVLFLAARRLSSVVGRIGMTTGGESARLGT
jgi:hypothetical protein